MKKSLLDVPTPSCHASTVVRTGDGVLIAWFGGTAEKSPDVGIYAARGENGVFGTPVRVSREEGTAHWNPVLWKRADGTAVLYYKVGAEIRDWETFVTESADGGKSWSVPRPLVPGDTTGGRGPVKNKPIRLSDGAVLAPASSEQGMWRAFTERSEDDGRSFCRSAFIESDGAGLIQPTLWESAPGRVHALLRTQAGRVYRSDSEDGGRTWSTAYPTALPNNNSGIDLAVDGDALYLALNPTTGTWGPRTPLVVMKSTDNGETFADFATLADDPIDDRHGREGQFCYPAIVARGGRLHITYTHNRKSIAYAEIRLREGRE